MFSSEAHWSERLLLMAHEGMRESETWTEGKVLELAQACGMTVRPPTKGTLGGFLLVHNDREAGFRYGLQVHWKPEVMQQATALMFSPHLTGLVGENQEWLSYFEDVLLASAGLGPYPYRLQERVVEIVVSNLEWLLHPSRRWKGAPVSTHVVLQSELDQLEAQGSNFAYRRVSPMPVHQATFEATQVLGELGSADHPWDTHWTQKSGATRWFVVLCQMAWDGPVLLRFGPMDRFELPKRGRIVLRFKGPAAFPAEVIETEWVGERGSHAFFFERTDLDWEVPLAYPRRWVHEFVPALERELGPLEIDVQEIV